MGEVDKVFPYIRAYIPLVYIGKKKKLLLISFKKRKRKNLIPMPNKRGNKI